VTRRRAVAEERKAASWQPFALAFGVAIVTVIFAGGGFYAVTNSQMHSFEKALAEHSQTFEKIGAVLKEEATARSKLRDEYMGEMRKQSEFFSTINTDVKVLGVKLDTLQGALAPKRDGQTTGATPRQQEK
jgi:uncharacterized protein HemX